MRTGLRHNIKSVLVTFISLLSAWLLFTFSFDPFSLLLGVLFSFIIALFSYDLFIDRYTRLGTGFIGLLNFILVYFFVLLKEIYLASLELVYYVISMRISPGIVKIKTGIKSDFGQAILANSISLTPGTVTIDIQRDYLLVHWLTVKTKNESKSSHLIKGNYEKLLKRAFE